MPCASSRRRRPRALEPLSADACASGAEVVHGQDAVPTPPRVRARPASQPVSRALGNGGAPTDRISWNGEQRLVAMSELSIFGGDERRGAVRYFHAIRQHWLLVTLLVAGSVAIAY